MNNTHNQLKILQAQAKRLRTALRENLSLQEQLKALHGGETPPVKSKEQLYIEKQRVRLSRK